MKRTQKILSILLSLAMLCSLAMPTAFAADSRYTDTTNHWAEIAIERWSDYGIIEGYGDAFNPDDAITRGQMATILSKTLGLTETAENPFTDISAGDWFTPYVLRCYKAGIMLGDNGKANPDAEITRQEAMTMFCRAFGIKADETADLTAFKDSGAIADWALPYVSALINGGIVSGVSSDMIAPLESMSRAALVTILDRAVVQYINNSGEHDLTDNDGIILVSAGDITLKGETKADILVTAAADGKTVTFKDATVTGAIAIQADNLNIIKDNATIPEIDTTNEGIKVEEKTATEAETPAPTKRPSSGGGGGGGGSSRPSTSNLTISEEKTVTGGTYNNVTITESVADGEVTLSGVTVKGDLTVKGGGSSSVKLIDCIINGKIIMAKENGEAPRLGLTNTPVANVEVQKPAIIEAVDAVSAIAKIEATASIEIKGESTKVETLAVPDSTESAVTVTVTAGSVVTVEAKAETSVTGAYNSVATIIAMAAVTADSATVQKVEIPETATESVSVTITGNSAVDIEVNSSNGAAITGDNVTISTDLETVPDNITIGGVAVTHIHKWGEPTVTEATCEQDGEKVYTCTAEGCGDTAKTKTEVIPKLGHNYGDWKQSDNDLHVRECANDKEHYEKAEHTWNEGAITTEANCGQEGVKTYTCSVCKGTKTETIAKPDHNWGEWAKVDATNHKRVCNNNKEHTEIAEHTPIVDNAVAATCTTEGKTEGSHCDICNSVIVEQTTVPELGHDFTGEYQKDADGHWHICTRDNCTETDTKSSHTYNTTNCAEVATCTACSYEKAAGEHTWGKWEKVDDTNHKHTCSSCNEPETAGHNWNDGVVTTEPTETTEGVKTYTCTACGATKTESVPVVSAGTIELKQNGTDIEATWAGYNCDNGYTWALVEDADIHQLDWVGNNVSASGDLKTSLTRIDSGVHSYDFVLYEYDESAEDYIGKELGRLENAIEVTITGEKVDYTMSFTAPADGQYQITLGGTSAPKAGDTYLTRWNRNKSNYSSIYVSDGTQTYTETTFMGALQSGDIYDLRLLTTYTLEEQTIKAVMTPPSTTTYEERTVWFSDDNEEGRLHVEWTAVDLADNEYYWFDGWGNKVSYYNILKVLGSIETDETMSIVVEKGTSDNRETLYSVENALTVSVEGNVQSYTIAGQADGTYTITAPSNDFSRKGFIYEMCTNDGTKITSGYSQDGNISAALYDGCSIKVREVKWTIGENGQTANVVLTPINTITTYTECPISEEIVAVTTFEELETALTIGGKVQLSNNITSNSNLMLYEGAPAELILNGYTLDLPVLQLDFGKTLTIDGTVEGSKIHYSSGTNRLGVYYYSSLTINGGTYQNMNCHTIREIVINGGTFGFDPTEYVDTTTHTVTDNGDGTYTVAEIVE